MRNHPVMGPATVSSSITIHGQTDSTADFGFPFLQGNFVCFDGQLFAVSQRNPNLSWKQWNQQDASYD